MTEVSNVGAGEQRVSPHSGPSVAVKKVWIIYPWLWTTVTYVVSCVHRTHSEW